MKISKVKRLSN